MKYDADIDLSGNASHALVAELVGRGKRVLDVGCATGYLSAALVQAGNKVSGVEIDPAAAALAEPVLEKLVVGDLERMDLAEQFAPGSFDVVIFADVLEHLTEPGKVLAQTAGLLDDGGYVVASIPNVAHGSVRLSLLQGRFEYRQLGLLDSTHLRWFTKDSVSDLFYDSGFLPTETRRTERQFFDTEIPLREDDFSPEVVANLRGDHDAYAFQYIVKAIPARGGDAGRSMLERIRTQEREIERRQAEMSALVRDTVPAALPLTVGLAGHFGVGDLTAELAAHVLRAELASRLPGAELRYLSLAQPTSTPSALLGQPIEFLAEGSEQRRAVLDSQLDAVIDGPVQTDRAKTGPGASAEPVSPLELPILINRHFDRGELVDRVRYLRVLGQLPAGPLIVVHAGGEGHDLADLGRQLSSLAGKLGATVVFVPAGGSDLTAALLEAVEGSVRWAPSSSAELPDALAVVADASVVVSDDAQLLWLAVGLGRPWIGLDPGADGHLDDLATATSSREMVARGGEDLGTAMRALDPAAGTVPAPPGLAATVDDGLDSLAVDIRRLAAARRSAADLRRSVADVEARLVSLTTVNAVLQAQLGAERLRLAQVIAQLGTVPVSPLGSAEFERVKVERDRAMAELEALLATRTMRTVEPARRIYARLRARTR